jgi:hypothetical protein
MSGKHIPIQDLRPLQDGNTHHTFGTSVECYMPSDHAEKTRVFGKEMLHLTLLGEVDPQE